MSIRSASVMTVAVVMRWFCSDCVVSFEEPADVESFPVIIFGVEAGSEAFSC